MRERERGLLEMGSLKSRERERERTELEWLGGGFYEKWVNNRMNRLG